GGYFRGAVVYTASGADTLSGGGGSRSLTGDRILVYSEVSLPAGRSSLSFYAYDMHRFRPRAYNSTNTVVVQVPRGNVLALGARLRSEEHTSELQSRGHLVCRLLLEKKKNPHFSALVCADHQNSPPQPPHRIL